MIRRPRAVTAAVALVVVLGLAAAGAGIARKAFDYDEVEHAHAAWLVAQGDRPFHDFFECHPPFAWYAAAPLVRVLPAPPNLLFSLRIVALAGTLAALVLLLANVCLHRPGIPWPWAFLAAAAVVLPSAVLDYAVELRPDSWSHALLLGALLLFRWGRPRRLSDRYAVYAFLTGCGLLLSPKLVFLPVAFSLADLAHTLPDRRRTAVALLSQAGGVGAALWAAWALLLAAGVDPRAAIDLSLRYHLLYNARSGWSHGLLDSVLRFPALAALVAAGVGAWATHLATTRSRPGRFELALLALLVAQLATVAPPYKQYFAPWLLLASGFVAFCGPALRSVSPRLASAALAVGLVACGLQAFASLGHYAGQDGAPALANLHRELLARTHPDARVAVPPPYHPVARRDTFYAWVRTIDPGGYGTEALMQDLDRPPFSARLTPAWYLRELDANPPAAIGLDPRGRLAFTPGQRATLQAWLARHGDEYVALQGGPAPVLLRRASR